MSWGAQRDWLVNGLGFSVLCMGRSACACRALRCGKDFEEEPVMRAAGVKHC